MIQPWINIAIVLALLAAMFGVLKLAEMLLHPHPEILRKLMHVGTGLIVLTFPWIFHATWPGVLLALLETIGLLAVRLMPPLKRRYSGVLMGVRRVSWGELYYPIAVGILVVLARGDKVLFVVPMLIVTLADTVAAMVGIAYGRLRYITSDGLKSAEGSIAFFTIAFFSVHVPVLLYTNVGRAQSLLVAVIIGLLSMLLEAIAWRGLDNLLIPIGAFAFLKLYFDASPQALLFRLAATGILLLFALIWRRRTSLDDSALMGCALFGYAAWMVGGWVWLIGPALLFVVHGARFPRKDSSRTHHMYAVLSVTAPALLWLGMNLTYGGPWFLIPYAVVFGAHRAMISISWIEPGASVRAYRSSLGTALLAGCFLAVLQITPLVQVSPAAFGWQIPIVILGVCVASVPFYLFHSRLYGPKGSSTAVHLVGFVAALLSSSAAMVLVILLRRIVS